MNVPHESTGKPTKPSKRAALQHWLSQRAEETSDSTPIGEAKFAELKQFLGPISESYLRKLLRDSGAPLAPVIGGVRQANLEELETSLLALLDEYERGDPSKRAAVRKLIITAKDHARWASRRPEHASTKEEMILWMITWLENPPVFREWLKLRRNRPISQLGP